MATVPDTIRPAGVSHAPHAPEWVELSPGESPGVTKLVGQLVDDTRDVVRTEIALVKAKVNERVAAYKEAAIFLVAAGVLALEALGALLVGLILTLATLVGPGWATLIVVGAVFAMAGVLAYLGIKKLSPAPTTGAKA